MTTEKTPTPRTDALWMNAEYEAKNSDNRIAAWSDFARELERELIAAHKRIEDDNRAYGCELRDPSGTIWEHATWLSGILAQRNDELTEAQETIRELRGFDGFVTAEELRNLQKELATLREDKARLETAVNTVQDERAVSFARLGKAVGGISLTEYQPEVDLEIEAAINALRGDNTRLKQALRIIEPFAADKAVSERADIVYDACRSVRSIIYAARKGTP